MPALSARSNLGVLGVVRMPDGLAQTLVEPCRIEDDLLCVHRRDGAQRNGKIAGVLDVDDQFATAMPRNLAYGAERLVMVGDEDFEAFLDRVHPGHSRSMAETQSFQKRMAAYRLAPVACCQSPLDHLRVA